MRVRPPMACWLAFLMLACFLPRAWSQEAKAPQEKGDYRAEVLALSDRIDQLLAAKWEKADITPAPLADRLTYFRRLNLDLMGRIPELLDIGDFRSADGPDRWFYVEKFLASKEYGQHFGAIWRDHILGTNPTPQIQGLAGQFEFWLRQHVQNNTPYDRMVHELLSSGQGGGFRNTGFQPGMQGGSPQAFFFANENKPENLAGATSRLFLGVKIECAQCHAHPFAKWTKDQFWEYAAFFSGYRPNVPQPKGQVPVAFQPGREINIPGTTKVVKAKFLDGKEPDWNKSPDPRTVLADWVVSSDNPYFARAAVDQVWQYFFGQSLLEPILEPSDDNLVTHPQLLDELAREFIAHKYDVKFLIRAIVHTQAYQRSSAGHAKARKEDLLFFARMPVRGLTPEQIYDSLWQATADFGEKQAQMVNNQGFNFQQQQTPRGQFLAKFTSTDKRHETQTSILQALFMMNGSFLAEKTNPDKNKVLNSIAGGHPFRDKNPRLIQGLSDHLPEALSQKLTSILDHGERIGTMYRLVLCRNPRPEEAERLVRYVENHPDRRKALSDVYWALLNSGEFLLNH